ncbi:hypothetical protein [Streptomyces mirabilis]|uniref:hypothetical protein n=1 Tax=Streptomyces mirabilis TaxID=68239 RepID=UPI00367EE5C5
MDDLRDGAGSAEVVVRGGRTVGFRPAGGEAALADVSAPGIRVPGRHGQETVVA